MKRPTDGMENLSPIERFIEKHHRKLAVAAIVPAIVLSSFFVHILKLAKHIVDIIT